MRVAIYTNLMPARIQQGMQRPNSASHSLVPFKSSLFSCWSVGDLQSPSPPPPSRRRKRSPDTAIPPRSRKRMRPSEHALRPEASGSGHGFREGPGRAPSPSPSFSAEYEFDDDDEVEIEEEEEYSRATERGSMAGHFAHEPTSASASTSAQQQKPKRTRQLTTPHQSAVLHALLAQSRFPTTAMREEVGRQIGLSARRVQVWFQNQRQKARKGTKDAAAAAATTVGSALPRDHGPPQFGPFTNAPPGPSGVPSSNYGESPDSSRPIRGAPRPQAGESSARTTYEFASGSSYTSFPISDRYGATMSSRRASEPSTDLHASSSVTSFPRSFGDALTGPGVPGSNASVDPLMQSVPASSSTYSRPLSPSNPLRLPPVHSITPPLPTLGRREGRSTPSSIAYESEQDLSPSSLRLPPLQLGHRVSSDIGARAPHGSSSSSHVQYSMRPAPAGSSTLPRSSVVASASSRGSGDFSPSSQSPPPIPPPFTLEPNPVWPSSSSSARNRTLTALSSYATPSSSSRQPPAGGEAGMIDRRTLPAPTRTIRFDPVRNTEVHPSRQPHRAHSRSPDDDT